MSILKNPILSTDSYKFSHFMQYPPGSEFVSSYIEARGTKIDGVKEVICLGLQTYIKDCLMKQITRDHVEEAKLFCEAHGVPFNYDGWLIIVNKHHGYLPIEIQAVPEGTPVTIGNVMLQIRNTDPRLPWLTSYIETDILRYIWYPSTVGTLSREMKKTIYRYLEKTSDNPDQEIGFKLHDFGFRGVSSFESAAIGGFAHLVNFLGTDTVAGIGHAMQYYEADVCGFSISASEHSTMTSWGQDYEFEAYKNMVDSYAKEGAMFACVIDSYDTMRAIDLWSVRQIDEDKSLLDMVKDAGATVVLRPDSGDPVDMPIAVIEKLMEYVGYDINTKGFKVLPKHVRVIQGDGIDIKDVRAILNKLAGKGISASNIAFGMGGGLLQKVNRDTFKFAMKANEININGVTYDVQKNPVTDSGKASKAGRQALILNEHGEMESVRESHVKFYDGNLLKIAYRSWRGDVVFAETDMIEVRKNAELK